MAAIFQLPYGTLLDSGGIIIPNGTVEFYDAGTTTPQDVYSDSGLSTAISQPIAADSAGRLPVIYLSTGQFKIVVKDALGNTLKTLDDLDSGVPASTGGIYAALPDFFTATTEADARSAIGAGAASDVTTLSSAVSAIQSQITGVGGTLGALAGKDSLANTDLATGFGCVLLQSTDVATTTSNISCNNTLSIDNTIPQISEGTQILSGSFTPKSASSILLIEISASGIGSTGMALILALFQDATANALAAIVNSAGTTGAQIRLRYRMSSWGTTESTLQARIANSTGTFYLNGNSSGGILGGVMKSYLHVDEILTV